MLKMIMIKLTIFFLHLLCINSITVLKHPFEKRIAYVYGIKNINKIDEKTMLNLQNNFKKHPLLIFKGLDEVLPVDFLNFVKIFDKDYDKEAINNPDDYKHRFLQPFNQFLLFSFILLSQS
jgi:hypothetical protein